MTSNNIDTTITDILSNKKFLKVNRQVQKTTGLPLVDVDFLKFIAEMKLNPGKFDTAPPPVPEGYEVVVDVRTGKGVLQKLPPAELTTSGDDGDASNVVSSE